eukprot:33476-Pleurochrysis_carterae.AAC.3
MNPIRPGRRIPLEWFPLREQRLWSRSVLFYVVDFSAAERPGLSGEDASQDFDVAVISRCRAFS